MSEQRDGAANEAPSEELLDRASMESFPASDAPGWVFPSSHQADPGSADPTAVVRRMFDAFRRGDVDGLLETVDPNSRWSYFGANPDPRHAHMRGHDEVRRFFEGILRRLDMQAFEPSEFVAEGSTVVVFGTEDGVLRKTGDAFHNAWVQKYVVQNGLIIEMVEFNIVVSPG